MALANDRPTNGTLVVTEVTAGQLVAAARCLGSSDGTRPREAPALPESEIGMGSEETLPPGPRLRWLSTAAGDAEFEPPQRDHGRPGEEHRPAPPPDTVVAGSSRGTADGEGPAKAREAALREEHAAELARLTRVLRETKKAHAAEIERLRAGHAADLRRLVEALWHAQNAARAASARADTEPASAARPQPRAPFARLRTWLARVVAGGALISPRRACASPSRIVRLLAGAFRAWR
jgi:hypothetical protein